jgi:hypothetical protein
MPRASIDMAPRGPAHGRELGYDDAWKTSQVDLFVKLAKNYLVASAGPGTSLP